MTAQDAIVKDGLTDVYNDFAMGNWCALPPVSSPDPADWLPRSAEKTAKDHSITREDQDAFALESYRRAAAAWTAGAFAREIAPVTIADARKGDTVVVEDEEYKKILPAKVPSLRPVFNKAGTVTAANASNLNDGASALVLMSEDKVKELGLKPLAKIICASRPAPTAHHIPTSASRASARPPSISKRLLAQPPQHILGVEAKS